MIDVQEKENAATVSGSSRANGLSRSTPISIPSNARGGDVSQHHRSLPARSAARSNPPLLDPAYASQMPVSSALSASLHHHLPADTGVPAAGSRQQHVYYGTGVGGVGEGGLGEAGVGEAGVGDADADADGEAEQPPRRSATTCVSGVTTVCEAPVKSLVIRRRVRRQAGQPRVRPRSPLPGEPGAGPRETAAPPPTPTAHSPDARRSGLGLHRRTQSSHDLLPTETKTVAVADETSTPCAVSACGGPPVQPAPQAVLSASQPVSPTGTHVHEDTRPLAASESAATSGEHSGARQATAHNRSQSAHGRGTRAVSVSAEPSPGVMIGRAVRTFFHSFRRWSFGEEGVSQERG